MHGNLLNLRLTILSRCLWEFDETCRLTQDAATSEVIRPQDYYTPTIMPSRAKANPPGDVDLSVFASFSILLFMRISSMAFMLPRFLCKHPTAMATSWEPRLVRFQKQI